MFDGNLIAAYRKTTYRVASVPPVDMRIDEANRAIDALLEQHGVRHAAFITAWNPRSARLAAEENDSAQDALLRDVEAKGFRWLPGSGEAYAGDWPAEPSILILGIDEDAARALSQAYGQNAFVWAAFGEPPSLILTL